MFTKTTGSDEIPARGGAEDGAIRPVVIPAILCDDLAPHVLPRGNFRRSDSTSIMRCGKRHLLATFAIVLCAIAAAHVAQAATQDADHLQAVAEDAYIKGDFARAYRFFELAYAADSTRVDNLHRQALCAGQLGQWAKADVLLHQVLESEAARPDAHFDLGLALYMQGRFIDALAQLELAQAKGVSSPSLDYYRGAILFRLGQYQQALEPLQSAAGALPQPTAHLNYYLGGSELALTSYDEAIENLRRAHELAEPGPFRDVIGRLLLQAEEKRRQRRWWEFSFKLGGAYDSNVFYEPEQFEVADRAGFYGFTDLDLTLYPLRRDWGSFGVGYRFYQSLHVDTTKEQLLSDFDLTSHMPHAEAALRVVSGKVPVFLGMGYEGSRHFLAGEHYQDANIYRPSLTIAERPWTATRLGVQLETNRFKDFNERDAFYASPSLTQLFSFDQGAGTLLVEASYEHNDADAPQYSYRGAGGYVATELTVYGPVDLLAGWRYRYLDYLKSDDKRIDRKIVIDAAFRIAATDWLAFVTGYGYQNNVSLDPYMYEKHVYYLQMSLDF
jgi:tetratricopeptide (TPR) repeat protein